ncbi:post-GPI attachment to proteins factor 2-like [Uloborus diversus]|uniref:post-GPI attachment to proteins factor 2-like n=1 Tax=Uloborus diversus TaxID=327109 RepID=UPI0024094A77|nr:post-GPI attachment to proteins factor 2-like [Uloborus diversus]
MSVLLKIPFKTFLIVTSLLPLTAFFFCVLWSLMFNFEDSTSTHCLVRNYLPSISNAVGGYSPQKYIWRMSIALHSTPRFLIALMYYNNFHYASSREIYSYLHTLTFLLLIFQCTEIFSLMGLTYISSSEDFPKHQKLFVSFVISALLSMMILYILLKHNISAQHSRCDRKSMRFKFTLLTVNFVTFCLSVYFYLRHNWYCEPGLYTLFALSEYLVVLSNIGYHVTSIWDFPSQSIIVTS